MEESRFSEHQSPQILKQAEAGTLVSELRREHGMGDATFSNWQARYGGMDAERLGDLLHLNTFELAQLDRLGLEFLRVPVRLLRITASGHSTSDFADSLCPLNRGNYKAGWMSLLGRKSLTPLHSPPLTPPVE